MKSPKAIARRRGQALVETAVVVVMLFFLTMSVVEMGWLFMRTNMIVNAARDGARFAATIAKTNRDASSCLTGASLTLIKDHVQAILDNVGFDAGGNITVHQPCVTSGAVSVPTVSVKVGGTMDYLFPHFLPSIGITLPSTVSRTMTFADEVRPNCNVACP